MTDTDTRVDVYLREQIPTPVSETVQTTVERLRTLERKGTIEELSVDSWGICTSECVNGGETVAATIEEFERWADRTGHSLQPAFGQREVSSMFCEGSVHRHEVPILSVAVYEDDALEYVAPCSDGERTHTVEDCLDALAGSGDAASDDVARANAGRP